MLLPARNMTIYSLRRKMRRSDWKKNTVDSFSAAQMERERERVRGSRKESTKKNGLKGLSLLNKNKKKKQIKRLKKLKIVYKNRLKANNGVKKENKKRFNLDAYHAKDKRVIKKRWQQRANLVQLENFLPGAHCHKIRVKCLM